MFWKTPSATLKWSWKKNWIAARIPSLSASVVEADVISNEEPLTYAYYQEVKGGKSSKNAPTYEKETKVTPPASGAARYVCTVCGYIYDPAKGDPDGGIAPGTKFEDIPDSWFCPVCGAEKSKFEKEK